MSLLPAAEEGRRAHALKVALELVYDRGLNETSTALIAKTAGMSESAFLRVFENKPGVLKALHQHCWSRLLDRIQPIYDDGACTASERLVGVAKAIWEMYTTEPQVVFVAICHCGSADVLVRREKGPTLLTPANQTYLKAVEDLCSEVVNDGLAPPGMTIRALREVILGVIDGVLVGWYTADKLCDSDDKVGIAEALDAVKLLTNWPSRPRTIRWAGKTPRESLGTVRHTPGAIEKARRMATS